MAFSVYIRQAIENNQVIFPGNAKMYGFCKECKDHKTGDRLKCLACLKKQRSAFGFAAQYMNNPIDEEAIEFKSVWFQETPITGDIASELKSQAGYLTVDPALRLKETNDPAGFVVTKIGKNNLVYILEAYAKRVNTQGIINEIFHLVDLYDIQTVGIETVGAQIALEFPLKQEMRKRHRFFKLDLLKTSTQETKAARIRGLIPYYANGQVMHRYGLTELKEQLIQFPRNMHDDIIDALAYQVQYWKTYSGQLKKPRSIPYLSAQWFMNQRIPGRMDQLFKEYKRR
jgi:predicted phage terminase large subunit-like protein